MRASNQDRERVATVLQKAMADGQITVAELESRLDSVYGAKTLGELEPSIADLPGHGLSLTKPVAPTSAGAVASVVPVSGGRSSTNLVGIMSGVMRKGAWVAPTSINCVAVMGGIELDFSTAQLSGMETVINVTAIMGGVDITVPAGMTVKVNGVGIMGAFEDNVNQTYGGDAPVLVVRGLALMGGVNVKGSKKAIG
jgi:hypothetical protein